MEDRPFQGARTDHSIRFLCVGLFLAKILSW
jgi:hypothetical protein